MNRNFEDNINRAHDGLVQRKAYPFEEEQVLVKFKSDRRFNVKLKYYTNCLDITHPVDFFQTAKDEEDAKVIALQKYPTGSDVTVAECFD